MCRGMEHAGCHAYRTVLPGLLYRNSLMLLLLRKSNMGDSVILPWRGVHPGSVSLPPLPTCWNTSPQLQRYVAGTPNKAPLV